MREENWIVWNKFGSGIDFGMMKCPGECCSVGNDGRQTLLGVRTRRLNQKEEKKVTEKTQSRPLLYPIAWRNDARREGNNDKAKKFEMRKQENQCNDLVKLLIECYG